MSVADLPAVTVVTGGVERAATAVTVERQMPALGLGSSGTGPALLAGTSSVVLGHENAVLAYPRPSPWARVNGFPPADGDPAVVSVAGAPVISGVVQEPSGSALRAAQMEVVDGVDRLRREVGFEPYGKGMPAVHVDQGFTLSPLDPALRVEHFVSATMRAAGFHVVPPPAATTGLFVPMIGSRIPDKGILASEIATPIAPTGWVTNCPWGGGLGLRIRLADFRSVNLFNVTDLDYVQYLHRAGTTAQNTIDFHDTTTYDRADGFSRARLTFSFPTSSTIRLIVQTQGLNLGEFDSLIDVTVPWSTATPWVRLQIGLGTGGVKVYSGDTLAATATYTRTTTSRNVSVVKIRSTTANAFGPMYLGKLADGDPVDRTQPLNATITASTVLSGALTASPFLTRRDALGLLLEITNAVCANLWIDGSGVLHWAGAGVLEARAASANVNSTSSILDLAWREEVGARSVTVNYEEPQTQFSSGAVASYIAWQASPQTLTVGDRVDWWMTAPSDEDWYLVDLLTWTWQATARWSSYYGATAVDPATGAETNPTSLLSYGHETINSQAYHAWVVQNTASTLEVITRSRNVGTAAGSGLPRLNVRGIVRWVPKSATGTAYGAASGADLQHDAGRWVQGSDVQALANWLSVRLTARRIVLDRLPVVWQTGLSLGQVLTVLDDAVYRVSLRCIITALYETHTPRGSELRLGLRVVSATNLP